MNGDFVFEREGDSRYQVYLRNPRLRLGMVTGKPGCWMAETPDGFGILKRWRVRHDAAVMLLDRAKYRGKIALANRSFTSDNVA